MATTLDDVATSLTAHDMAVKAQIEKLEQAIKSTQGTNATAVPDIEPTTTAISDLGTT